MKKWMLLSLSMVVISCFCVDFFIPSSISVSRLVPARCKAVAAFPFLSDEMKWGVWWPGRLSRAAFHVRQLSYQSVGITIGRGRDALDSRLNLLSVGGQDSLLLDWETQLHSGWNPIDRVRTFRQARQLSGQLDEILLAASSFLGKRENLYGIPIGEGSTTDTLLIASRAIKTGPPANEDIYALVSKLGRYVREMGSRQTGYPMVNVMPSVDKPGDFQMMVAMPVANVLPGKGDIFFMRLIPGRYLITEVTGGATTVDRALSGLRDYIRDHERTVMAIPFQSLVTDRMSEPDSARWVTRIYYPVM